ncbi:MAG: hypothetical protein ABL908_15355 [Hyphomicrobium sp.]
MTKSAQFLGEPEKMLNRFAVVVSVAACVMASVPPPMTASEAWMSAADLETQFRGVEIDGHYASGRTFSEDYRADGRLEYRERDRQTRGRWSVEAGSFCTIYDMDTSGGCYRVKRVGRNCFEFYFIARTEEQAQRDPNAPSWTARGWVKSEKATCADGASV